MHAGFDAGALGFYRRQVDKAKERSAWWAESAVICVHLLSRAFGMLEFGVSAVWNMMSMPTSANVKFSKLQVHTRTVYVL